MNSNSNQVAESIQLAQSDLLVSLKTLASIPYLDVRNDTITGLLALLQEGMTERTFPLFLLSYTTMFVWIYYAPDHW